MAVSFYLGAAALGAAPLVLIVLIGWGAGLATLAVMSSTGADKKIGDILSK